MNGNDANELIFSFGTISTTKNLIYLKDGLKRAKIKFIDGSLLLKCSVGFKILLMHHLSHGSLDITQKLCYLEVAQDKM